MENATSTIKFIVHQLNVRLGKKLNVISFDGLRGDQRLETLLQVLHLIDPTISLESFEVADPEEVVMRILDMLRVFKYVPPSHIEPSNFSAGLIGGEKSVVNHILAYLLKELNSLKTRAYLSRFLVKVEVSPEVEGDNDIVQLYQQYEQLIETFKMMHTNRESLKKSTASGLELQKDIKAMEDEKDQVSQKLSNLKRKVDTTTNNQLFITVSMLQEERNKKKIMLEQNAQLTRTTKELDAHYRKLSKHLKELRNSCPVDQVLDANVLFEKLAEENEAKQQLAFDVLPKELECIKNDVQTLEDIDAQPSIGSQHLERIDLRKQLVNREINSIVEKNMVEGPMDEKLLLFRQNAGAVTKRRDEMRAKLSSSEMKLRTLQERLDAKKDKFEGKILIGEEMTKYVAMTKEKEARFKKSKRELSEIRMEIKHYSRTVAITNRYMTAAIVSLENLEEERGITGYFYMMESNLASADTPPTIGDSIEEVTASVRKLKVVIANKKRVLEELSLQLKPVKRSYHDLVNELGHKKPIYDTTAAQLESELVILEADVIKSRKVLMTLEKSVFGDNCELEVFEAILELMAEEGKFTDDEDAPIKSQSMTARFKKELFEQQLANEELKGKVKQLKDNEENAKRQIKLWTDLKLLMDAKQRCHERQVAAKTERKKSMANQDRLVL